MAAHTDTIRSLCCTSCPGDPMASYGEGDFMEMEDVQAAVGARHNPTPPTLSFGSAGAAPPAPGAGARDGARRTFVYEDDDDVDF